MIEVRVDHFDTAEGLLILSLKGAAVEASWENLRKGLIVEARVTKTNKGGLDVEVDGIRGFLPIGQIDINRVEDASIYVNQKLRVVVTEANQREKNLVVSRRELLEQERAEKREQTWKTLEEGQVHKGVVRSIKDVRRLRRDRRRRRPDPRRRHELVAGLRPLRASLKVGDEVEVKVLKIDRDHPEGRPRPEAAHAQPLGPRRGEVPPGPDRQGQGHPADGLRRLRRARARASRG